jgi:hypothetical protein
MKVRDGALRAVMMPRLALPSEAVGLTAVEVCEAGEGEAAGRCL